jgi:very-short-patch-repair endonuclease
MHLRKPGPLGLRFRRQTPIGPYIADFFCPSRKLIVEIDGSQHAMPARSRDDQRRDDWLRRQGYRVLRISNADVMTNIDGVYDAITHAATGEH